MEKKKLPIGKSDFKEIIQRNYYYVDKTSFIEEILEKGAEVLLITRPRRFGKTLNMSTLKYFLDMEGKEENRKLFNGLYIKNTQYMEEQGKYPVIFLTMKELEGDNYTECLKSFKTLLRKLFNRFEYLRDSLNQSDLQEFDNIWLKKEDSEVSTALKFLSELLYRFHKIKPVLLIDEYDSPMILANEKGYYKEVKNLMGTFYGSALKDGICSFAVVTGILKVAKESIFSSLNNLDVSTILSKNYNHFGMSEKEVEEILKYYNWETTLEKTKEWYNGYLFGSSRVYNPWSILKHCQHGSLEPFWVNTSTNSLIKEILKNADREIFETFHSILQKKIVKTALQENMIFGQKYSGKTLLYLMFSAGYLTIEREETEEEREGKEVFAPREYYLRIPNNEIKSFFRETFEDILFEYSTSNFERLLKALKEGELLKTVDSVEGIFQDMFLSSMSSLDGDKENEKFYHNLILGSMMLLSHKYHVFSNRETGFGRYDLALESRNSLFLSYIFEFKVASSEEEMDKKGEEALLQIEEKIYDKDFRTRGIEYIKKLGVVFFKKKIKVYVR